MTSYKMWASTALWYDAIIRGIICSMYKSHIILNSCNQFFSTPNLLWRINKISLLVFPHLWINVYKNGIVRLIWNYRKLQLEINMLNTWLTTWAFVMYLMYLILFGGDYVESKIGVSWNLLKIKEISFVNKGTSYRTKKTLSTIKGSVWNCKSGMRPIFYEYRSISSGLVETKFSNK